MHVLRFGFSQEFIEIRLPRSISHQNWAKAEVEIAVEGFRGTISPFFDKSDFTLFLVELAQLSDKLKGVARLQPLDRQFFVQLSVDAVGHLTIAGEAWSRATFGNKLTFEIELDQTFLQTPSVQLTDIVRAWAEE